MSAWRKFYVDLVDGPKRGERIELPIGKPDFLVMPEVELSFSLEPPSEVTPCNNQPIRYCAMERGEIMAGRTEEGWEYRIEQWSVDGRREEYDRIFWQAIAAANRQANIEQALRVIESGGYELF